MADNINISFYGVTLLRDKARVTTIVSVRMIKYCFAILALLVSTQVLAYEKTVPRYALVIGNSNYGFSALPNTINDATDIAAALEDLDYRVTLAFDLKPEEMARVVRDFYQQISSDEAIAIFYYAGHAIQSDSTNYLIPVGADISDLDSLELNAFSMDQLLYSIKILLFSMPAVIILSTRLKQAIKITLALCNCRTVWHHSKRRLIHWLPMRPNLAMLPQMAKEEMGPIQKHY